MLKTYLRLIRLVLSYKWWMLLAAFIGFLTVGSSVGLLMTSAYIIARAALHPSVAELQVAIVGVRFFGIARGLFRYLERLISHEVTFRLLANFRIWFYKAVEPLAPARLMRFKSGDLLSRLVADVESLQNFYVRVLAPPLTAVLVSLLMWLLFGMFSWLLSLLLLLFLALAGIGVPAATLWLSRRYDDRLSRLQGEFSTLTVESLQGMADLLIYGQAEKRQRRFGELGDQLVALQQKSSMLNAMHESATGLLMNSAVFVILVCAIPFISKGVFDAVYLSVLTLGTMAAFEGVMPLPAAALHLRENLRAAERLFEIADTPPAVMPAVNPAPPPRDYAIEFRNVTFAYENQKPVLRNFNLRIRQGARLLIVGPSGVGKTTIADLLRRFWDVQGGEILFGGLGIDQFSQETLADLIGYVPQRPHLFSGTIRDNLMLGKADASEEEMHQACRAARINDFIARLPDGLDAWIGEHGLRLSGGERQRLALARALIKDTPVLIFDEPMANVDSVNARSIFESIGRIRSDKTLIVISHQPLAAHGWDMLAIPSLSDHDVDSPGVNPVFQ